jgi:NAD(P) transhydrogenase
MQRTYDLIVIGSGPGGKNTAISCAKGGLKVLVIENRREIGGACLHTGTIPSKTLREAAQQFSLTRNRKLYANNPNFCDPLSFTEVLYRLNTVIHNDMEVVQHQFLRNHIDVVIGEASFIDSQTIKVLDENGDALKFKTKYVMIATGSSPNRPNEVPFDDEVICDSDSILNMKELPKSLIVVGAGVIGSEYACIFSQLGVKVHLINKYQDILNFIDKDIRSLLTDEMKSSGIMIHANANIESIKRTKDGKALVSLSSGVELEAAKLLYSMGRNGNISSLNLAAAGLKPAKYDLLSVNEKFQTEVETIFACGDVIGYPSLASVSAEQGRLAGYYILGRNTHKMSDRYPYGIYTIPEVSFVGKTEEQLIEQNTPYVSGIAHYKEIARGQIQGDQKGILKILIHQDNLKLLGVHVVGIGASELVHIGQAVMSFDGDLHYFLDNVFNYPTLAEAYKIAALNAMNRLPPSCFI